MNNSRQKGMKRIMGPQNVQVSDRKEKTQTFVFKKRCEGLGLQRQGLGPVTMRE